MPEDEYERQETKTTFRRTLRDTSKVSLVFLVCKEQCLWLPPPLCTFCKRQAQLGDTLICVCKGYGERASVVVCQTFNPKTLGLIPWRDRVSDRYSVPPSLLFVQTCLCLSPLCANIKNPISNCCNKKTVSRHCADSELIFRALLCPLLILRVHIEAVSWPRWGAR